MFQERGQHVGPAAGAGDGLVAVSAVTGIAVVALVIDYVLRRRREE